MLKGVLGVIATRDTELGLGNVDLTVPAEPAPAGPTPAARRTVAVVGTVAGFIVINALMSALAPDPFRWWANFITLAGLVVLAFAIGLARIVRETRLVLTWLGSIILVTGLLLFAHAMGDLWPLMIVVPCLGPVGLFALRPSDPSVRAFVDTVAGLAMVAVALGVAFLLIRSDTIDLGGQRWWAWFMLAAAAVPALNGLVLMTLRRGIYWFSMAVLLMALGGYTALAALAEFNR